jgi:SNF2 family DNA or RNA helicase
MEPQLTLLLVLIKSWTEEIHKFKSLPPFTTCNILTRHRHIYGGLRVCEYHGRGRETNVEAIANADIVLSTYHTVAGESSKTTSPLFRIYWFRIVLDEGTYYLSNICYTLLITMLSTYHSHGLNSLLRISKTT